MLPLAVDSTYWQQRVAYEILASVDEPSGVLSGMSVSLRQSIADTLRDFYVHQYLNAFRPGSRWPRRIPRRAVPFSTCRIPTTRSNGSRKRRSAHRIIRTRPTRRSRTGACHGRRSRRFDRPHDFLEGSALDVASATGQARAGRFDFAQWYPKVVVYDRYGWEPHPVSGRRVLRRIRQL